MRALACTSLIVGSLLACSAGCASETASGSSAPLIGATLTTDYEASVFVRSLGGGRCSGSLVHPRIVVTAWHCMTPDAIQIDVTTTALGTTAYDVIDRFVHPGTFVADIDHMALDVAVLVLDRDVAGVTPYVLAYDGLVERVDQPLRGVAYGGGSSLFGQRQTNTGTLVCDARRSGSSFDFPMLTTILGAPGDSGGSVLDERGALLGVMSGMISGGCIYRGATRFSMGSEVWAARVELSWDLVRDAFTSIGASAPIPPVDGGTALDAPASGDGGAPDGSLSDGGPIDDAGLDTPSFDAMPPADAEVPRLDAGGMGDSGAPIPPSGCACRASARRGVIWPWLLLVGVLSARGSRRDRRRGWDRVPR